MMSSSRSEPKGSRGRRRVAAVTVVVALMFGGFGAIVSSLTGDRTASAARGEPDPTVPPDTGPATDPPGPVETDPPAVEDTSPPQWSDPGPPESAWTPEPPATQWQPEQNVTPSVPNSSVPVDTETSQTAPMTTTENLLIGPSTTQAPSTTVARRSLSGSSVTRTDGSSDPKIWAIVAALGTVGVGLGVATFFYWRRTRPEDDVPTGGPPRTRFSDLTITSPDPG